jgi:hypothetical protein
VGFAAITLCVASQRVFIVVYFVMIQSGNFWIHPYMGRCELAATGSGQEAVADPCDHGNETFTKCE